MRAINYFASLVMLSVDFQDAMTKKIHRKIPNPAK